MSAAEMCSAIRLSAASALSPTRTIPTFEVPGGRIDREPLETTKTFSRRRAARGRSPRAPGIHHHRRKTSCLLNPRLGSSEPAAALWPFAAD
jgi:hypothetical protein